MRIKSCDRFGWAGLFIVLCPLNTTTIGTLSGDILSYHLIISCSNEARRNVFQRHDYALLCIEQRRADTLITLRALGKLEQ